MKTITEEIDAILSARGMSRRQLAIAAKIPPSSFQSAMARGKGMTVEMLMAVADALNVDPYTLMDFDMASKRLSQRMNEELSTQLINSFSKLNDLGQQRALEYVLELAEIPKYRK